MLKRFSFLLLLIFAVLAGCTTGRIERQLDRVSNTISQSNPPGFLLNYVIKYSSFGQSSGKSGGMSSGAHALGEPKWETLTTTTGANNTITLLVASNRDLYKPDDLVRLRADSMDLSNVLDEHLRVLQTLIEKPIPKLDVTFRMIPPDAKYRFVKDMPPKMPQRISMELLALAPQGELVGELWKQRLTKTAIHEYIHVLRWDETLFARKITSSEDEAQAYTLDGCITAITQNRLPLSMSTSKLPITLQELLGDYPEVPVSELITQLVEQRKDHPTVIGFNAALLAVYRLGQAYPAGGYSLTKPDMAPFQAYCRAVAKDEINWLSPDLERQIKAFAQAK